MKKTPFEIMQEQTNIVSDALYAGIKLQKKIQEEKKRQTFEDFLREQHAEDYHGTDDDMPDAYDAWVSSLDGGDVMGFAQEWGNTLN